MGIRSLRASILSCSLPAVLIGAALLASGCLPWMSKAPAETPPPDPRPSTTPVLVSGPSPFASCTLGGEGTRYVNGEVESWVAVNPQALKEGRVELLGAWMADRWSNGGGSGLVSAFSPDGGATWTTTPLTFNGCSPGGLTPHSRASDPWVSLGPDGTAYASALIVDQVKGHVAIGAAASADGGRTWGEYNVIQAERLYQSASGTSGVFLDKEAVTADPTRPGTAYMVWTRNDGYGKMAHGSVMLAKTVDGGKSWSTPATIWAAPVRHHAVGAIIWADPGDGTLYHLFRWFRWPQGQEEPVTFVGFQRSTDAGATWSEAKELSAITSSEVKHAASPQPIRTGGALPLAAVDPRTGRIYVVWEDSRWEPGVVQVALSYSDDKGETWSKPERVSPADKATAFRPTVAVNDQGQMAVAYYRFLPSGEEKIPTQLYLSVYRPSAAGLGQAVESAVGQRFDLDYAPKAMGPFLGDYIGLVGFGEWFHLFYVAAGEGPANPSDVWAVSVKP